MANYGSEEEQLTVSRRILINNTKKLPQLYKETSLRLIEHLTNDTISEHTKFQIVADLLKTLLENA